MTFICDYRLLKLQEEKLVVRHNIRQKNEVAHRLAKEAS